MKIVAFRNADEQGILAKEVCAENRFHFVLYIGISQTRDDRIVLEYHLSDPRPCNGSCRFWREGQPEQRINF